MRLIFLDVDGVLNSALTKDRFKGMMGLDERFIMNLKKLVDKSNKVDETKIVLTSTWRLGKNKDGNDIPEHYAYLNERLRRHGLEIYDETPSIKYSYDSYKGCRGREIMTWIYQHRDMDITGMVIIDDVVYEDYKKYSLGSYFVKCDYFSERGGFIEPLVDKALKRLDTGLDLKELLAALENK